MATLTADITASATLIPISAAVAKGFYTIDSEAFYVTGMSKGPTGRGRRLFASVDRGAAGTTAATHSSAATLASYHPDAAGIQQAAIADVGALTQLAAPAGGTGAAAGGWDTSGNRDLARASINAGRDDIATLKTKVNAILTALRANGIIDT